MMFISVLVLAFSIAYAEPLQGNSVDADSSGQRLSFIGFEEFENGLPVGMDTTLITMTGNSSSVNLFERDSTVYLSGNSSLRISADDSTDQWYYIELDIPGDFRCVTATISVKASGLHQSGNQYDNCTIGFLYNGLEGNRTMLLEQLPRDNYDWTEASVTLDTETEPARNIKFIILSTISGTLWIDDLSFQYDDECEAIPEDTPTGVTME